MIAERDYITEAQSDHVAHWLLSYRGLHSGLHHVECTWKDCHYRSRPAPLLDTARKAVRHVMAHYREQSPGDYREHRKSMEREPA